MEKKLLKGIYQTAIGYGFTYYSTEERLFILRMMEAALMRNSDFEEKNAQVDNMIEGITLIGEKDLEEQLQKTSSAFAVDMLLLKFVQGFPPVGVLGGVTNPIYYKKIMRYVQMKYHKRYLMAAAQRNG